MGTRKHTNKAETSGWAQQFKAKVLFMDQRSITREIILNNKGVKKSVGHSFVIRSQDLGFVVNKNQ